MTTTKRRFSDQRTSIFFFLYSIGRRRLTTSEVLLFMWSHANHLIAASSSISSFFSLSLFHFNWFTLIPFFFVLFSIVFYLNFPYILFISCIQFGGCVFARVFNLAIEVSIFDFDRLGVCKNQKRKVWDFVSTAQGKEKEVRTNAISRHRGNAHIFG